MTEARALSARRATQSPPPVDSLDAVQMARRDRIVAAAIEMMLETEYDRIQMKDVSARAGVALGTTYRYFASKDHLLAEALLAWSRRFPNMHPEPERTGAARRRSGRSVDELKKAYRLAVRAFEPHPTVYGAMVLLQSSSDSYAAPLFEEFAASQTAAFARFLPRLEPERRDDVVMVMSAVLDVHLRAWAMGRLPIEDVYRTVDAAADLILGP